MGKDDFFFRKIWSYTLDGKWKMIFLKKKKKKYTEIWYFLQTFWKDGLSKKDQASTWSFLHYFFPNIWYFFPGQKVRGGVSQEINGNMTFSVYRYRCDKRGATPLCQKKSKMVLSRKNTPKGDWRSRLTS